MVCEQSFKCPCPLLNVNRAAPEQAANHGKHVGTGTNQRFAVFSGYSANGGQGATETFRLGEHLLRCRRGPRFGRGREKAPECKIVSTFLQSGLCQCKVGMAGHSNDRLFPEQPAGGGQ